MQQTAERSSDVQPEYTERQARDLRQPRLPAPLATSAVQGVCVRARGAMAASPPADLLAFYRCRVGAFEDEREELLQRIAACSVGASEAHSLRCEAQKRAEEVRDLQVCSRGALMRRLALGAVGSCAERPKELSASRGAVSSWVGHPLLPTTHESAAARAH